MSDVEPPVNVAEVCADEFYVQAIAHGEQPDDDLLTLLLVAWRDTARLSEEDG